jgi:DNA-directed RNA polymerase specialized sigma subunit
LDDDEREFVEQWEGALGNLNQNEIAAKLGVSAATVTRIKERALKKLRDCLERGEDS